ncbi:MAG: HAD family hydrolase [Candidatus Eiseniibacteriota bacterium]
MAADAPDEPLADSPLALLFDWDNTLVDNWGSIVDAMNVTLTAMGHKPWNEAEARRRIRRSMRETFPLLFGDGWTEAQRIFYERFEAAHLNALRPLPGADAMLERFKTEGLYLGVVSNKRGDLLRREVTHLGWDRYFSRLIGAGDAPQDKPAVAPVDMALEGSGIERGPAVWFVGDSPLDIDCARNAGCVAVLLGPADRELDVVGRSIPDFRVDDCAMLVKLARPD